jgi:raffinose/stachyose/melibiose transport system permease protein
MIISRKEKSFRYFVIGIGILLTFLPLLWLLLLSFKSSTEIIAGSMLQLPEMFRFENYIEAWTNGIGKYFLNSVVITAASSALTLALGLPMAYAVSRMHWKLSSTTLTILMAGIMIPVHATLIPVFMIIKTLGMLNTYASIVLPYVASTLPITVYIVRNFMLTLPYELEEAAFLDGCGVIRAFLRIIVPSIKHSLVVVITFNFLTYWNEYVMASTLVTNPQMYTLPIGLRSFASEYLVNYGAIAAGVVISVIPLLAAYLLFSDVLEKGMVAGALK